MFNHVRGNYFNNYLDVQKGSSMKKMQLAGKFAVALLVVPMVFLPGCGWLECLRGKKDAAAEGKPVVTMAGDVVITTKSFEAEFEQLLEENPHLKSVLALMPDAKKNFLMGMVNQNVVDKWVSANKIDQKEEYQKELDRMMRSVKRMLNTKYFGLEHPVQVGENEVAEFYDKNKDSMPDLIVSRGGVKASGVSFEKEADAKAFLAKVREMKDISKAANAAHVTKNLRDFKMVNSQSLGMDAALREKIVSLEKVPTVELVKVNDKSFWVVSATAKEESQYRPLEQVKAGLEQYVAKEKRMEMFDKEISKLKADYNVVINEDALNPEPATQVADAQQEPAQAVVADANVQAAPAQETVAANEAAPVQPAQAA